METDLEQLASLYGIETTYQDARGNPQRADPEALLRVLQVLGAPVAKAEDVPDALRARRQGLWQHPLEPVIVAWDGMLPGVPLNFANSAAPTTLHCHLELEAGDLHNWPVSWDDLTLQETADVEGVLYQSRRLLLPHRLPNGYHRLTVQAEGKSWETLLLSAPLQAYEAPAERARQWGVFLPLYALHSERSWGVGDFGDLGALMDWMRKQGGGPVGTLPLLAAFLDEPFEPSPYSPASRLFWNELYLDVTASPEWPRCPAAQALVGSADFQAELQALRQAPLVEYQQLLALKRRALVELARVFFANPDGRLADLQRFVQDLPQVEDYARYRAVLDRRRTSWHNWPQPLRDGVLSAHDYDEEARRYHLYVQWLADEQLRTLSDRAGGAGLYLDFPLGVNADSYDVWRERSVFAVGVSGGAPPDPFFPGGQNWGFPPLHPERLRAQGYRYLAACLRHHMQFAGLLRIDHMMGLHRLFWVPQGMEARHGVYVRYPSEELYAVFSLESHRNHTVLVGEDLGTVPAELRPTMARHRVHRMYVVQYELEPESQEELPPVPDGALASLNTHDMPTFNAFWNGLDLADRRELGLLDDKGVERETERREKVRAFVVEALRREGYLGEADDAAAVLRALLLFLAASPDQLLLVNLEDLWLSPNAQNVPGTWKERPNWRRKAAHSLEELTRMPEVVEVLRVVDEEVRRQRAAPLAPAGEAVPPT